MAQPSEDFLRLANAAKARIRLVPPEEVARLIDQGAVVLDVREKEEFVQGHLPTAVHLSRGMLEMNIADHVSDKFTPILCYCGGGNRGALAADTLRQMGYVNVSSLDGGLKAYHAHSK